MNKITLSGVITKEPIFSHEVYGEKFYEFKLKSERKSEVADELIVTASETLISDYTVLGMPVKIVGEIRTYNVHNEERNRLHIFVFARDVSMYDTEHDENNVELDGYICKPPVYRQTPLGRKIAEVMVACNRPYGKSDYIPTVAWERNARRVGDMEVGTYIRVWGRMKSREYTKELEDGSQIRKVAYELSASRIEEVGEEE